MPLLCESLYPVIRLYTTFSHNFLPAHLCVSAWGTVDLRKSHNMAAVATASSTTALAMVVLHSPSWINECVQLPVCSLPFQVVSVEGAEESALNERLGGAGWRATAATTGDKVFVHAADAAGVSDSVSLDWDSVAGLLAVSSARMPLVVDGTRHLAGTRQFLAEKVSTLVHGSLIMQVALPKPVSAGKRPRDANTEQGTAESKEGTKAPRLSTISVAKQVAQSAAAGGAPPTFSVDQMVQACQDSAFGGRTEGELRSSFKRGLTRLVKRGKVRAVPGSEGKSDETLYELAL